VAGEKLVVHKRLAAVGRVGTTPQELAGGLTSLTTGQASEDIGRPQKVILDVT
jgi:hypothetical protein